jgi:hypothetical protein
MKCPNCFSLNTAEDDVCYTCKTPLRQQRGWGGDQSPSATPGWAYVFAGLCGLIPIVALGGCVPVAVGIGGASTCLGLSRLRRLPGAVRVIGCIAITGTAWVVFAAVLVAMRAAFK